MITLSQYFQGKPHSMQHELAAGQLLAKVNPLLREYQEAHGIGAEIDPDTGSEISGSKGGAGDGGFRLPNATTGAPNSSHKQACAVDVYDPAGGLDEWLTDDKLEEYGLYREHPDDTIHWCHLTTRAPGSGRRTFHP